ncbi:hypothetical protein SBA4_490002 [Candidatus Sulfopaludibacter sp. SbA4]|nr:hypothetical protein SBA4_490002 [Candidatus Sulfopaludibacter sp. SbA4]
MDLTKVLQQLHEELENLDAAILSLEKLQDTTMRRGRPSGWLAEVDRRKAGTPKRKPGRKELKDGSG